LITSHAFRTGFHCRMKKASTQAFQSLPVLFKSLMP
jgi:hypothetical protein